MFEKIVANYETKKKIIEKNNGISLEKYIFPFIIPII